MVNRFGKSCRTFLAGSWSVGGAVGRLGGRWTAGRSPAAAATPPAWTAYVVSYNDDAVIPVNTATDAVGTPITVGTRALGHRHHAGRLHRLRHGRGHHE